MWDFSRDRGWDGNIDGRDGDRDVGDLESDIHFGDDEGDRDVLYSKRMNYLCCNCTDSRTIPML